MLNKLKETLKSHKNIVIVGIGNEMRGDDGAGIYIANKLLGHVQNAANNGQKIQVLIGGATPENLTGTIKKIKPSHILLIDAAEMGLKPGEISVLDPGNITGINFSTHSFSLSTFADYLKREIGAETVILGIQSKKTGLEEQMSEEVKESAYKIIIGLIPVLAQVRVDQQ
ncbi:MAG: hydrogenase maturation peptidase HycI [Candidatus Saganbacteria bacterium]|nr:hydrogenase maturation peptidase HycI [Candidatus Saganbacteria bacterium]